MRIECNFDTMDDLKFEDFMSMIEKFKFEGELGYSRRIDSRDDVKEYMVMSVGRALNLLSNIFQFYPQEDESEWLGCLFMATETEVLQWLKSRYLQKDNYEKLFYNDYVRGRIDFVLGIAGKNKADISDIELFWVEEVRIIDMINWAKGYKIPIPQNLKDVDEKIDKKILASRMSSNESINILTGNNLGDRIIEFVGKYKEKNQHYTIVNNADNMRNIGFTDTQKFEAAIDGLEEDGLINKREAIEVVGNYKKFFLQLTSDGWEKLDEIINSNLKPREVEQNLASNESQESGQSAKTVGRGQEIDYSKIFEALFKIFGKSELFKKQEGSQFKQDYIAAQSQSLAAAIKELDANQKSLPLFRKKKRSSLLVGSQVKIKIVSNGIKIAAKKDAGDINKPQLEEIIKQINSYLK